MKIETCCVLKTMALSVLYVLIISTASLWMAGWK